ncbi:MAG TPA: M1 family aminopeptidase [Blastocatellia bacterium]|nr:M1 family aminopeptidase [Blastocatellia bacterium]
MIHRRGNLYSNSFSNSYRKPVSRLLRALHPRYAKAIACAAIVILASGLWLPQASPALGQQAGKAPQIQWPRSHDYHVTHYRIELNVDFEAESISGETTVNLEPFKSGLKEIELDAGEMTIKSVTLAGGAPLKFRYEGNEKLYAELDRGYPAGSALAVVVAYSAVPKRGLTFIKPNASDPKRPYQVWSQGEAQTNHYWFPCYDYPNDKASSETITTVPEQYTVISNGELVDVKSDPAKKTKTYHWKMDRPFSSYLVSIVAGQYAEVKGRFKNIPVVSYVYPEEIEEGRVSLGRLPDMVAFFSTKIGYDYPYSKYTEETVEDFPGAMENITATTLTETAVHDQRAELDQSSDLLIAHELAHQWFGDLLTCRDWGQIWLNESFAEFFADLWDEHHRGEDDYLYDMLSNQNQYYQAWHQGIRRPVVTNLYDDPDGIFDVYAYPRGAATVSLLRHVLGEDLFWKAIHHYVEKFQWRNVDTGELADAIEESTGQNLDWFFDEWVYKMGHPVFEVSSSYDPAAGSVKLSVSQTQKPDNKTPWFQQPDFFTTPVDVGITTAAGEKIERIMIDKPVQEFTFKVDSKPLIVNFDRDNYVIKELKFSKTNDELEYQAIHDASVMGRIWAIDQLKSKTGSGVVSTLAEAANDKFWGSRLEAVHGLAALKGDGSKTALQRALNDSSAQVRRGAVEGLAMYKDKNLAPVFVKLIGSDASYQVVADAARALGESGAPDAYAVLNELMTKDSWRDSIRGGAMRGLAALKDPRTLDLALKYAGPGNSPGLRGAAFSAMAELGKGNDHVLDVLTAALKEHSDQIVFAALQSLGALGDARAVPALEELNERPDIPGFAKGFIEAVIRRLKSQAASKN